MKRRGFTLVELMVSIVAGLIAVSAVYSLGAGMSQRFHLEQRSAGTQGMSRAAMLELRRDIARAGLFGTPNAARESSCEVPLNLPRLGGVNTPLGAFQYYADEDIALIDTVANPGARADRLRVMTSLYSTDLLTAHSIDPAGRQIIFQSDNQAFRRTFGWGAGWGPGPSGDRDFLTGAVRPDNGGGLSGISALGARAFGRGTLVHIESPEGRHFFRLLNTTTPLQQVTTAGVPEVRANLNGVLAPLPVGTACLPGAGEGSMVSPLQWVEYALVNPAALNEGGTDFMSMNRVFQADATAGHPWNDIAGNTAATLFEAPNLVLVRRMLDAQSGLPITGSTQVIAEFVTHFEVSFWVDQNSGTPWNPGSATGAPNLALLTGTAAETAINNFPERVRSVVITVGVRSPVEDPNLVKDVAANDLHRLTRFDVDPAARGSASVQQVRLEIPITHLGRKNL